MARQMAVLLSQAQARALVRAAVDANTLHQEDDPSDVHWQKTEGRVLERAVAAIERAARAEEIDL